MKNYDEFYDFMEQYTDFYAEVSENEKTKMDALASEDLEQINKVLADYQVTSDEKHNHHAKHSQQLNHWGAKFRSDENFLVKMIIDVIFLLEFYLIYLIILL